MLSPETKTNFLFALKNKNEVKFDETQASFFSIEK